jgi:hypothetical protein
VRRASSKRRRKKSILMGSHEYFNDECHAIKILSCSSSDLSKNNSNHMLFLNNSASPQQHRPAAHRHSEKQQHALANEIINRNLLQAPKHTSARRVRSISPANLISNVITKSRSSDASKKIDNSAATTTETNGSVSAAVGSGGAERKQSHMNLLGVAGSGGTSGAGNNMRSSQSINSTFSSASSFLPTPDMLANSRSPSLSNSATPLPSGVVNAAQNNQQGSTVAKTEDEQLDSKKHAKATRESSRGSFLSTLSSTVQRLTSSVSMTPVRIHLQAEETAAMAAAADRQRNNSAADLNQTRHPSTASCFDSEHYQQYHHQRENTLIRASFVAAVTNPNNSTAVASAKPGSEVLSLISIWIRNAPNDFMG